jgi:hypothetical protein
VQTRARLAGWWTAITVGGWALAAALSSLSGATAVFASFDVPVATGAVGLVWLMKCASSAPQAST